MLTTARCHPDPAEREKDLLFFILASDSWLLTPAFPQLICRQSSCNLPPVQSQPALRGQFVALSPGTQLAEYRILNLIGVGGMGEVYRAHDTKLNRDVALKVLPEAFARDPERLARFDREARVLASLNHPNIGARSEERRVGKECRL